MKNEHSPYSIIWFINSCIILALGILGLRSILHLNINQILSIHLTLASSLCLGFGLAHLTGFLGPGMWTSDSLNLVGSIRFVKASFNLLAYARLAYGVISSHHIISGFFK